MVAEVEEGTHQYDVDELGVTVVFKLEIGELLSENGVPVALRRFCSALKVRFERLRCNPTTHFSVCSKNDAK